MTEERYFRGKIGQNVNFFKNTPNLIKITFFDETILLYSFTVGFHPTEQNIQSLISMMQQKWNLGFNLILKTEKEELYELIELNSKEQT